jgi:AraC-like DNA-binding protein
VSDALVLERLVGEATSLVGRDSALARALLQRALALLRSNKAQPEASGLAPWQERRVAAFIDDNLAGGVTLDELARVAKLSSSYFARAFKRSFGQSPHQFVIGRRIARAQTLMVSGDEPLCQIALQCGFSDQAHLSRVFRRLIGMPPKAWRSAEAVP